MLHTPGMLQIYNEGVYDLINFNPKSHKSLPLKWDATHGFYVQGLKVVPCGLQKTMMEVSRGGSSRCTAACHAVQHVV